MKNHTATILAIILTAIILASSSCATKYPTFQELRNHKASKILRETFDFYAATNCREYATEGARIFDEKQFAMLKEKFLVSLVEKNEFEEYELDIAIAPKNHPEKIVMWHLVLSEDAMEKSGYKITKFYEYNFVSDDGDKTWPFNKEHSAYWLQPIAKTIKQKKYCIGSYPAGIIYETGLPQKLRQIFNAYSKKDAANLQKINEISEEEIVEYKKLFLEKFIVTSIRKTRNVEDCGVETGYSLNVFISPKKLESFEFDLFQNEKNEYEICNIRSYPMTDFRKRRYYYWRQFKKYWI